MPYELGCTMVKVGTGIPSVQSFPMSCISQTSRDIIASIKENFPGAISDDGQNAVMSPSQIVDILDTWRTEMQKNIFFTQTAPFLPYMDEMTALAEDGHTMMLIAE
jgi:hypothetical protein